ncbi:hypothetical protein CVS40_7643 [Lucilia cuprina]|nr:hypothetical protein CVS40_7643 [Lucilia cuprina]
MPKLWCSGNLKVRKRTAFIERFGSHLRFVATTEWFERWQFIYGEVEVENDREFWEIIILKAIDENLYRSVYWAHHEERTDSFDTLSNITVILAEGIGIESNSFAMPSFHPEMVVKRHQLVWVVGFQFHKCPNCNGCIKTATVMSLSVYVIDNNAYSPGQKC